MKGATRFSPRWNKGKRQHAAVDWAPFNRDVPWDVAVNTAVPLERLQQLANR